MRSWALVALAACYAPSIQPGAPCPNNVCPRGLVCSPATMTCEREAVDAAIIDPDVPLLPVGCYGGGMLALCPNTPIQGNTTFTVSNNVSLVTTNSPLCAPYHLVDGSADNTYCVIAARTITVTTTGRWMISGTRPLVVIAKDALTIDGTLDAASHAKPLIGGPNANASACVAGGAPTLDDGGPGGSFGTSGGAGGGTDQGPTVAAAAPSPKPATLRGGCPGRDGGGGNRGLGGAGGGAVYLIATALHVNGTINASGAGGDGAGLSAGGGGGGSGGMIGLDAPAIVVGNAARIFANGGGGGEGGGGANGGNDGADPMLPATPAPGGGGNAGAGGDAGDGATAAAAGATGLNGVDSGGGGGGGVGVIRVFPSQALGGSISPPPS